MRQRRTVFPPEDGNAPRAPGARERRGNRARHAARAAGRTDGRTDGRSADAAPSPFWDAAPAHLEPARPPEENFSVQVAARHYVRPLLEELGPRVLGARGRLVLARGSAAAAWAQNVWFQPRWIPVASIGDAARKLTALQRNWRAHVPPPGVEPGFRRRLALIGEALPHVGGRPLAFGDPTPPAPLGAFTLWREDLLLASPRTASPFADGEARFLENRDDPPGRAYLKLWELFTLLGRRPRPGDLCVDLGASPGGWTWVLASLGCRVFSVDKAPLAPSVGRMTGVSSCQGSGFALDPRHAGRVDWLFSDMICYPEKLLETVLRWLEAGACRNVVCTLKFQSETDHRTARRFAAIPGGSLRHLSCNKHELTFVRLED